MKKRLLALAGAGAALAIGAGVDEAAAQQAEADAPPRIEKFAVHSSPIELTGPARADEYLGVTGPRSAWLGTESGAAEVWVHPLKVARKLELAFQVPEYDDPIPGSAVARTVTVRPELTTITYAHQSFTVRQHVLAPADESGLLVLLDVRAVRPLEIVVTFEPVLQLMWPGAFGGQYLFWDASNRAFVLSESTRRRHAVIGSPWATEALTQPAHRLAEAPARFRIPIDGDRIGDEFVPIAIAAGSGARQEAMETYHSLIAGAAAHYEAKRAWADSILARTAVLDTPDDELDLALQWAKVNLEEQRVCNPDLGCGLVAGWGPSGTSFRPGFGWFFGGDAAMNTLAMDVTGQWELVAEDLRFLARYQRADGKIPHEVSQAAAHIDWFEGFPYAYYHADTTPWWMAAVWQYWRASGDDAFLAEIWPAFRKAWDWCMTVETDGDGLLENTSAGLAAVEVGEIGAGVHQDVYLASVWTAALRGAAALAEAVGDEAVRRRAMELRETAEASLNGAYWSPARGHLAFALLRDGGVSDHLTVWPAAGLMFGLFDEGPAAATLRRLSRDAVTTDWGARMLSSDSELYDPLQYNSGTVWPFVTGFLGLAHYRYRRPWSGYGLLDAVKQMTFDGSLGRHPELLSGAFYAPLDATVPHQFFASSMLPTMLIRGLLGWDPDAPERSATLAPQLPPDWPRLEVGNLAVGETRLRVTVERGARRTDLHVESSGGPVELSYLASLPVGAVNLVVRVDGAAVEPTAGATAQGGTLRIPLRLDGTERHVAVEWTGGLEVIPPRVDLMAGQASGGLRVVAFGAAADGWRLDVEGDADRTYMLKLVGSPVRVLDAGGERAPGARVLSFEAGVTELELRFPAPGPARPLLTVRLTEEP